MPGKSKRKQQRYATKKQSGAVQAPAVTSATTVVPAARSGTVVTSKPQTPSGKASGSNVKTVATGYTPELLKHVGTELKITLALSGFIVAVIIALAFILH
jgi:hypothetical protein